MEFIGRQVELEKLNDEYNRNNSFVVIYGRRRVGKTTLIKQFIKDKIAFYYLATEELESQSMKRFGNLIGRVTGNSLLSKATLNDWLDLFTLIKEYEPTQKKVLVIDEFPYLVKSNSAFPSILQKACDEILKDNNVMLILCGSMISMMLKHTMSYDSPLYGRRTSQIRLLPLSFTEVYQTRQLSFSNAVEQYAVTGGVPKYVELFDDQYNLLEQLKINVFSKNGFLYEEPLFLLKSENMSAANYFSIIKVISDGNHRLSKIASVLGESVSTLTPYLTVLIDFGFVEKRVPITEKNPEKSRKGLYFISDSFIRFWFQYVYPFRSDLELDNQEIVIDHINKDFQEKFVAFAYEDICKDIFINLCKTKQVDFTISRIGSYWRNDKSDNTELDVVAIDNTNKQVFIGECKYHKQPIDAITYFTLKENVENNIEIKKSFPNYKIIYGLFSKSDFTNRVKEIARDNPSLLLINEDKIIK